MPYGQALWNEWFSVAEPLNRFTGWATIGLTFLWWALYPISSVGYNLILLRDTMWILILLVISGLFYIIILQKAIRNRDLTKKTHIWLIICFGLSVFCVSGAFMWAQFVLVGILSDTPFWAAFREGRFRYY